MGLAAPTALLAQSLSDELLVLKSEALSVVVQVDDDPAIAWSLVAGLEIDRFPLECAEGQTRRISYRSALDEIAFDLQRGDIRQLDISTPDGRTFRNEARCLPEIARYGGSLTDLKPATTGFNDYLKTIVQAHPHAAIEGSIIGVWSNGGQLLSHVGAKREDSAISGDDVQAGELFEFASVSKEFTTIRMLQLV